MTLGHYLNRELGVAKEVRMTIGGVHLPVHLPHHEELVKEFYHDAVYGLLKSGVLVPNTFKILQHGLAGIEDGLKRLSAVQGPRLKLVAHPQENSKMI